MIKEMSLDTHHHHHAKPDYNRAFAIGVSLNSITAWFFVSGKDHDRPCMQSINCAE